MIVTTLSKNNGDWRSNEPVKRIKMSDKTSKGQLRYQGRGSSYGREFSRGRRNLYVRSQGCGLNMTKCKVREKCKAL